MGLLTPPLRARFGIQDTLEFYSVEELDLILQRSAARLDIAITASGSLELARRSRGTPRIANRLLKRVRDFAQVEGDGTIDVEIAQLSLARLQVDEEGLDGMDRRILDAIANKFDGGPVGLSNLAAAIGEEAHTIEEVYEPFLIQRGLVQRTPRGRVLTSSGFGHMQLPSPAQPRPQEELF
jgi:Holliday junction DNA helicase RuvB